MREREREKEGEEEDFGGMGWVWGLAIKGGKELLGCVKKYFHSEGTKNFREIVIFVRKEIAYNLISDKKWIETSLTMKWSVYNSKSLFLIHVRS